MLSHITCYKGIGLFTLHIEKTNPSVFKNPNKSFSICCMTHMQYQKDNVMQPSIQRQTIYQKYTCGYNRYLPSFP